MFTIYHNLPVSKTENKSESIFEFSSNGIEKAPENRSSEAAAQAKPKKIDPAKTSPSTPSAEKASSRPEENKKTGINPPKSFLNYQKKYRLVAIPTYEGTFQLTHPKILYFENGWNGYKYWMSMTPYPRGVDLYENPSIVVSNDGNTWCAPPGLKNPAVKPPKDSKAGGHYSDPHLVMRDDILELWYRYNPAKANAKNRRLPDNSVNIYFRRRSVDGINWTPPEKLLQSKDGHLSLCELYQDDFYETWYATYGGALFYSQSKDAKTWSSPIRCDVPLPKGFQSYHQDMIKYGSTYYLLQTAEKTESYPFQLFLLTSNDGIHFKNSQQIYPDKSTGPWDKISFYRSTLFIKDNRLNVYISLIIPHLNWFITKTILPIPNPTG